MRILKLFGYAAGLMALALLIGVIEHPSMLTRRLPLLFAVVTLPAFLIILIGEGIRSLVLMLRRKDLDGSILRKIKYSLLAFPLYLVAMLVSLRLAPASSPGGVFVFAMIPLIFVVAIVMMVAVLYRFEA
jgi:hypothetical protein